MNRRNILALLGLAGAAPWLAAQARRPARKPIVLYCDLVVDPAREAEMLRAFRTRFRPAAESFRGRGFVDLTMLKIRTVIQAVRRRRRASTIASSSPMRARSSGRSG